MTLKRNKQIRLRAMLVAVGFVLLLSVISAKAVYLHVFQGPWLSEKAAVQYEVADRLRGKRGTIYDRNCEELAVSVEVTSVAAEPRRVKSPRRTAAALARPLGLTAGDLTERLGKNRRFVWVKRHATPKQVEQIRTLNLEGILFVPEFSRFYPNKTLAAQVLGFSGIDGRGLEGIEFKYQNTLQGKATEFPVVKDALGRRINLDVETHMGAEVTGRHLVLTIDNKIQYTSEKALQETVARFKAKSGIALVMDPHTGAVLALAHAPVFNPNAFQLFGRNMWRNRAVTDPFEPGSTLKVFVAAAALESGLCTPRTIFYCEKGHYRIGKNVIHDAGDHTYGWLSLQQIIKYSSNIGAVKLGERIGAEKLYDTLKAFGFGNRTQIDCPGETTGTLSHFDSWSKMDLAAISFGQGISVSAVQLATAVSTIANGGRVMRPYVVQATMDRNGRLIKSVMPRQTGRAVSAETARTVRRIMATVTTKGGTGVKAALKTHRVGGKTGTAQKAGPGGSYAPDKYVASFVGFAPVEKPQVVVLVVIDEPQGAHYGGTVAGPAFRQITSETLHYLSVHKRKKGWNWMVSRQGERRG
jgi:cell division protein FtsI (penicillin-binding protein 3)